MNFSEPSNLDIKTKILNRIYIIAGGGLNVNMESEMAGGIQIDLDYFIIFGKQLGRRSYRGGFVIPLYDRSVHFGFIGEHKDFKDIDSKSSVDKIGVVGGIALGGDEKRTPESVRKEIEEAQEWLKKNEVEL